MCPSTDAHLYQIFIDLLDEEFYAVKHGPDFSFLQLNLIGERDEVPIHFCDKCGLPIHLYGRMVSYSVFADLESIGG